MLIIVIDIFITLRLRKRIVTHASQDENVNRRNKNLQTQMFILMFASIVIFLLTNLPYAIGKILLPRDTQVVSSAARLTTIWTILGWIQSLNYAVNQKTEIDRI